MAADKRDRLRSQRRRMGGLGLLEFSVVAAIFALLAGGLLSALLYYQERAEKIAVETTIVNMQSGLRWQMAERIVSGRQSSMIELVNTNPVDWLDRRPSGYMGELPGAIARDVEPGGWVYDPRKKELGYRPRLSSHLVPRDTELLRWRIRARRVSAGMAEGVEIEKVNSYSWF